jgi:hypothetical protein
LVAAGLVVSLSAPCFSQEPLPNSKKSELRLAVRVYNYAQAPERSLARAEGRAAEVFRHAGAEIVWLEGLGSGGQGGTVGVDDQPTASRYLVLNIVMRQQAAHVARGMEPLGFAMPCSAEDPVCRAYVFYDRVDDLAKNEGLPTNQIFGYVLAHELGHLFLGPHCHTSDGIMRGMWGSKDLRYTTRGVLHFGPQQAQVIREVVEQRMRLEISSQIQIPVASAAR